MLKTVAHLDAWSTSRAADDTEAAWCTRKQINGMVWAGGLHNDTPAQVGPIGGPGGSTLCHVGPRLAPICRVSRRRLKLQPRVSAPDDRAVVPSESWPQRRLRSTPAHQRLGAAAGSLLGIKLPHLLGGSRKSVHRTENKSCQSSWQSRPNQANSRLAAITRHQDSSTLPAASVFTNVYSMKCMQFRDFRRLHRMLSSLLATR